MKSIEIRTVDVVQYIKPLREGGSLPAIVKADDGFLYVLKFRGAGQGKKALVADFLGGELARAIGFKVPEMVFMTLDDSFSQTEPDEEIQDLLKFSVGLNLGVHFLSGSITYDPLVSKVDPLEASKLVLLDSLISNIDRTAKNPNILMWHNELWVIDNGASFYFHHNWETWKNHLTKTFPLVKDHVLLSRATQLDAAAEEILRKLDGPSLSAIISKIPDDWLISDSDSMSVAEMRNAYLEYIHAKLAMMAHLVKEAKDAK
ncbi:MAG: HipA family kinase [Aquaticitalea sp.]